MTKDEALTMALGNLLQATRHLGVCPATVDAAEEALAQPSDSVEQERNFCPRCGKRLMSALGPVSLHTCCPPQGRTFDDYGNKIV